MYCIHCGKKLEENAAFCSACGQPVQRPDAPVEHIVAPPVAPPVALSPAAPPETALPSPRKLGKGAIIGIVAGGVGLLAAICLLVIVLLRGGKDTTAPTADGAGQSEASSEPVLGEEYLLGAWLGDAGDGGNPVLIFGRNGACKQLMTQAQGSGTGLDGWRSGAWVSGGLVAGYYSAVGGEILFSWEREEHSDVAERAAILGENEMTIQSAELGRRVTYRRVDAPGVLNDALPATLMAETGQAFEEADGNEEDFSEGEPEAQEDMPQQATEQSPGAEQPAPAPAGLFAGGNGTAESPYLVETAAQFNEVRNHLTAHFLQTQDIKLSGEHEPIGTLTHGGEEFHLNKPFIGVYDGGGHKITGLSITTAEGMRSTGLFGLVDEGGVVRNLRVNGLIQVYGCPDSMVYGGIAGYNWGVIENCTSDLTLDLSGRLFAVGGVVGANMHQVIGCTFNGLIEASSADDGDRAGGIVGMNLSTGVIKDCTHKGDVAAVFCAGGIAATNEGVIQNCKSSGSHFSYTGNDGAMFAEGDGKVIG